MKKILLLTIGLVFALAMPTFAQSEKTVYINVSETESGYEKQYTVFDTETSTVQYKCIYNYNSADARLGKTLYKWDKKQGWIGVQKYDYNAINAMGSPIVLYSEWDSSKDSWDVKGSYLINLDTDFEEMLANELVRQK